MIRRATIILSLAGSLAACGGTGPTPAPSGSPIPSVVPTASPTLNPTLPQSPSATASTVTGGVAYDEALLQLLPADIDGLTFESQPEAVATVADDPLLALAADRVAFGVVADPVSGELAAASIVHLRADAFGDAFFRAYRDTYDAAACEPAGGVDGHAETDIGGHHTFIGTCTGGARTYHVFLDAQRAVISIVSVGDTKRLGERIVQGLRG